MLTTVNTFPRALNETKIVRARWPVVPNTLRKNKEATVTSASSISSFVAALKNVNQNNLPRIGKKLTRNMLY